MVRASGVYEDLPKHGRPTQVRENGNFPEGKRKDGRMYQGVSRQLQLQSESDRGAPEMAEICRQCQ